MSKKKASTPTHYVKRLTLRLTLDDLKRLAIVRQRFPIENQNKTIQTCIRIAAKRGSVADE